MTIKEIRALTGLTQAKFGERYGIPKRTIQNWESSVEKKNHHKCPVYVEKLLERVVKEDYKRVDHE